MKISVLLDDLYTETKRYEQLIELTEDIDATARVRKLTVNWYEPYFPRSAEVLNELLVDYVGDNLHLILEHILNAQLEKVNELKRRYIEAVSHDST